MDVTHADLDAAGIPAYLAATSEQNQRLYHRHGYTDMTPAQINLSDGSALFRMWRPAQTG